MIDPDSSLAWWQAAFYTGLAAVAGALGYVMRTLDSGGRLTWARALIEGGSAGFVGLLTMWVCESIGLSQQLTAVTVGVFGWIGASASVQVIQKLVWSKLGINKEPKNDDASR